MVAIEVPDWHRVITLVGVDDADKSHIVMVDTGGNLVAVVKGDHDGTLTTLTVDDAGRLQIVPYDPDDIWGQAIAMGNAELASRLNPVFGFDRRGNVIWTDSFDNGLNKWYLGDMFDNARVELSSIKAFAGTYACKLVTSDAEDLFTWLARDFQPTKVGRVGCECSYQIVDDVVDYVIGISHFDGTDEYAYKIKHDTSASKLYYWNITPEWVELAANVHPVISPTGWNTMKLVIDLKNEKYVRVLFNDTEKAMDDLVSQHTTIGTSPALYTVILAYGDTDATYVTYVDKVILTQNEPPNPE